MEGSSALAAVSNFSEALAFSLSLPSPSRTRSLPSAIGGAGRESAKVSVSRISRFRGCTRFLVARLFTSRRRRGPLGGLVRVASSSRRSARGRLVSYGRSRHGLRASRRRFRPERAMDSRRGRGGARGAVEGSFRRARASGGFRGERTKARALAHGSLRGSRRGPASSRYVLRVQLPRRARGPDVLGSTIVSRADGSGEWAAKRASGIGLTMTSLLDRWNAAPSVLWALGMGSLGLLAWTALALASRTATWLARRSRGYCSTPSFPI